MSAECIDPNEPLTIFNRPDKPEQKSLTQSRKARKEKPQDESL